MYSAYIWSGLEEEGGIGAKRDDTSRARWSRFTAIEVSRGVNSRSCRTFGESWRMETRTRICDRDVSLSGRKNRFPNPLEDQFPRCRRSTVCNQATSYMYELAPLLLTERESLYCVTYVKILAICYRLRMRVRECIRMSVR